MGWRTTWHRRTAWFAAAFGFLSLLLAVVVITQAAALHSHGWGPALGTIPESVAAVGTVGALWVAILGWRYDVNYRRDAELRAQADLLTAWIEGTPQDDAAVSIGLINASNGVVYDVEVGIDLETEYARFESRDPTNPHPPPAQLTSRGYLPVLAPGHWTIRLERQRGTFVFPSKRLDLYFRDQRGTGWTRDHRGYLAHADKPLFAPPEPLGLNPLARIPPTHERIQTPEAERA